MRKDNLSCISLITGWTAGYLVFSFTQLWVEILGFTLIIAGSYILILKFCDNDVKSTPSEVKKE